MNKQHKYGRTPLFYAVKNNHKSIAALLLEHGANPHIRDRVRHLRFSILWRTGLLLFLQIGCIPLHLAAGGGHKELIELLLQCNSDINAEVRVHSSSFSFFLCVLLCVEAQQKDREMVQS